MQAIRIDMPAIRATVRQLKADYPRKRGVCLYLAPTFASGDERVFLGFEPWDGTRRDLLKLAMSTAHLSGLQLTLCLAHWAIAANEPAALAAKADITGLVFAPAVVATEVPNTATRTCTGRAIKSQRRKKSH